MIIQDKRLTDYVVCRDAIIDFQFVRNKTPKNTLKRKK